MRALILILAIAFCGASLTACGKSQEQINKEGMKKYRKRVEAQNKLYAESNAEIMRKSDERAKRDAAAAQKK